MDSLSETLAAIQRNAAARAASGTGVPPPPTNPDCACRGTGFFAYTDGVYVHCPRCNPAPDLARAHLTVDSPIPPGMSFDSWTMRDDYADALEVARYVES